MSEETPAPRPPDPAWPPPQPAYPAPPGYLPPAYQPAPVLPSFPHAAPTPYHQMLRTWTYRPWKPMVGIVVGIVGAVIAGLLFGVNMNAGITIESFLYALIGAVILLASVNLIRRGTGR